MYVKKRNKVTCLLFSVKTASKARDLIRIHLEHNYYEINGELRTVLGIPSLQEISIDQCKISGLKNTYISNKYYLDSKENHLNKQYLECDSNWIYVISANTNIFIKKSDTDFDIEDSNNNNIDIAFTTPISKSRKINSLIKNTSILFKNKTKMLFEIGK